MVKNVFFQLSDDNEKKQYCSLVVKIMAGLLEIGFSEINFVVTGDTICWGSPYGQLKPTKACSPTSPERSIWLAALGRPTPSEGTTDSAVPQPPVTAQ